MVQMRLTSVNFMDLLKEICFKIWWFNFFCLILLRKILLFALFYWEDMAIGCLACRFA